MSQSAVVYLVRHAKAGERRVWGHADWQRPLSKRGWSQAEQIAERLAKKGATDLYSSPYVRCVQTLEPLAKTLGVTVVEDIRLEEEQPFEPALELVLTAPSGSVLCSHGDIIPDVVQALYRRGMELQSQADWRKGSIWVLKRKGDRITKGKVWPPPIG